jgi:hypothetical protein
VKRASRKQNPSHNFHPKRREHQHASPDPSWRKVTAQPGRFIESLTLIVNELVTNATGCQRRASRDKSQNLAWLLEVRGGIHWSATRREEGANTQPRACAATLPGTPRQLHATC